MKQGHYLELVTTLDGPWNLDFDIYWDGRKHHSLAFGLRNAYGLPPGQVVNLQQRLLGSGGAYSSISGRRWAARAFGSIGYTVASVRSTAAKARCSGDEDVTVYRLARQGDYTPCTALRGAAGTMWGTRPPPSWWSVTGT